MCSGGQLTFVCTTNRTFIEWNITVLDSMGIRISRTRLLSTGSQSVESQTVNMIVFDITRRSKLDSTPLISTLSVANVTTGLNGTLINCTDIESSLTETSTSVATVQVIKATGKLCVMIIFQGTNYW